VQGWRGVIGDWLEQLRRAVENIGAAGERRPCACGPDWAFAARPPEKPRRPEKSKVEEVPKFPRVPSPELLPGPERIEQTFKVRFRCECGKVLQVKWELAGKTGRCPACHQLVQIPDA
jgi:hypothetical protein